jgi:hypothetical protein
VGANGGRVEDEGANSARVEDEGAWYEAEVEPQLPEDEGWCERRYPSPPQKFIVCINHPIRPTSCGPLSCPNCALLSRSDVLLVRRNFSKYDLI